MKTTSDRSYETVVVGGGTAGAGIAGLLAQRLGESVLLIEAGPDYGPLTSGDWPQDLLDYTALPTSHQWGYNSAGAYPDRTVAFERARVIGGCSSHNGCAAIWGSAIDYDGWAAAGNAGWSSAELRPVFELAMERLAVRSCEPSEITPFHAAVLEAAPGIGIPAVADLNDLNADVGIAPFSLNVAAGVRFNAAFGFLDPVREQPHFSILADTVVDRVHTERGKVVGLDVHTGGERSVVRAERVILAAGAYGSPAILMRSGIGAADALRGVGVQPLHELPGVGENLHDHPAVVLRFAGSAELVRRIERFAADRLCPEEQTIAKARSPFCEDAFDLHLCPIGGADPERPGGHRWMIMAACMDPLSRGHVRLADTDPASSPLIDHRYVSDEAQHDARILEAGIDLARELAAAEPFAGLLGAEIAGPGGGLLTPAEVIENGCVHYYHPVGSCKMGPADDPTAVVDPTGQVHGLEGLYVADCSVMPVIPRANTNIPAAVVGLKIASGLLGHDGAETTPGE